MKNFGWRFDKINSKTIYFFETPELDGSNCVKNPLRNSAILNKEKDENSCFLWSILASL